MTTIPDRLIAASDDGALLQATADLDDGQLSDDSLAREISNAHNAGLIDAVATFRGLKNSSNRNYTGVSLGGVCTLLH